MKRRTFIKSTGALGALYLVGKSPAVEARSPFPVVRVHPSKRNFTSKAIERAISEFKRNIKNPELSWLFENCFPNTLDTTVFHSVINEIPQTYVITGDIDAMWLRDSSAQVWPYLDFISKDKSLLQLITGVINKQISCILMDPYANAFYNDPSRVGIWANDKTEMKPGIHERKWEIDSLCYPIRLAYRYWKVTGDTGPFNDRWKKSVQLTLKVFKEQQRKENPGPYRFLRGTSQSKSNLFLTGYGSPVKPTGLICSAFRPSDDPAIFQFLIPSNFFAVSSLNQAAEMITAILKDNAFAEQLRSLASEVEKALHAHAIVEHPAYGKVYAYEINGFGDYNIMDDANVPSLLSLPYLGAVKDTDPVYINTRKLLFSEANVYFFKGKAAEGIGGPHVGKDMIWPMSIIMKGLTSNNDSEIKECISALIKTHRETGFMHESFHKDDPKRFTRPWFAWTNSLFGEFLWKIHKEKPGLI